ncbi:MAG: helix-turn-helix transcriptional regulator [Flavobacteriales bacterium]|jgi:putative transcriptional regulator|nr:helix-turn-helix transcriptional regulator [Flavobacteriales bacterium]
MEKQEFLLNLGNRIKSIRKEKGISQSELAWRCNKDKQSIERIENAKVNPSIFILSQLAKALDISLSELTNGL